MPIEDILMEQNTLIKEQNQLMKDIIKKIMDAGSYTPPKSEEGRKQAPKKKRRTKKEIEAEKAAKESVSNTPPPPPAPTAETRKFTHEGIEYDVPNTVAEGMETSWIALQPKVEPSLTLDDLRKVVMDASGEKGSGEVVMTISKYAKTIEEISVDKYNEFLADIEALPSKAVIPPPPPPPPAPTVAA